MHYICTHNKYINKLMINTLTSKYIWVILLSFAIALLSCKKDDENKEETPAVTNPILTAQIDGVAFNASAIELGQEDGIYTLSGIGSGDKTLTLIFNNTAIGTYTLTFDEVSMMYSVGAVTWTGGPTAAGTITISNNANGKLSGSFQAVLDELMFTGTSVQITSGSFEGIAY
jgi:Family of unknown function (DUF6252)